MKQTVLNYEGAPETWETALHALLPEAEHLIGSFHSYEQAVVEVHMTAAPGGEKNELLKAAYGVFRATTQSVERLCRQARELEPETTENEPTGEPVPPLPAVPENTDGVGHGEEKVADEAFLEKSLSEAEEKAEAAAGQWL